MQDSAEKLVSQHQYADDALDNFASFMFADEDEGEVDADLGSSSCEREPDGQHASLDLLAKVGADVRALSGTRHSTIVSSHVSYQQAASCSHSTEERTYSAERDCCEHII